MLALSFSIEAADVPFSDVPYGIQASSDLEAGVALFQSGRFEDAIRAFSREIERDPEGPDAAEVYAWLGYAYFCKGWSSEALKAYEESFAGTTDPDLQVRHCLPWVNCIWITVTMTRLCLRSMMLSGCLVGKSRL